MEVVRIVMLGMTGVLLGLFLKGTRPEYSVYLSLAAGVLILSFYMTDKRFLPFFFCDEDPGLPASGRRISVYSFKDHRDYLYRTVCFRDLQGCRLWFYWSPDRDLYQALYYGPVHAGAPGPYGNHTRFPVMRGKDRQKKTALLAFLLLLGILFLTEPALAAGEIGKSTGEEAGTTPDGRSNRRDRKAEVKPGRGPGRGAPSGTEEKPGVSPGRTGTGRDAGGGK